MRRFEETLCRAATGEPLFHPLSKKTTADGTPEGMALIPSGAFTMGEGRSAHTVSLSRYAMSKYPVTNAQWKAFVEETGTRAIPRYWKGSTYPKEKANHSVLWVSFTNALRYCQWVSEKTGLAVSLPTEAQWEKAARGPKGTFYPWGNEPNEKNCNYSGVCAAHYGIEPREWRSFTSTETYHQLAEEGGYTLPVGSYPQGKSGYGCYEMAGNAYSWCLDWYRRDYDTLKGADKDPQGPSESEAEYVVRASEHGKVKVVRGGSWYAHFSSCRSTYREVNRRAEGGYHTVGFRIVCNFPEVIEKKAAR